MVTKFDTGDVVLVPVEICAARKFLGDILYDLEDEIATVTENSVVGQAKPSNALYLWENVRQAVAVIGDMDKAIGERKCTNSLCALTDEQIQAIDTLWGELHKHPPFSEENLRKKFYSCPSDIQMGCTDGFNTVHSGNSNAFLS